VFPSRSWERGHKRITMSPWVEVERSDRSGPDSAATATIMRAAIAFSAHFVRSFPDILSARWVKLFVDDEARRLGFRFSDKPLENALSLTPNGSKRNTHGRVVQTQAVITQYSWLRAISELRDVKSRLGLHRAFVLHCSAAFLRAQRRGTVRYLFNRCRYLPICSRYRYRLHWTGQHPF
jgi:hypothetical protein